MVVDKYWTRGAAATTLPVEREPSGHGRLDRNRAEVGNHGE